MEATARIDHPKGQPTMTLSVDDRRANLREALISFLNALGDRQFDHFFIEPAKFPEVLPTTWVELTNRHWIEEVDMNGALCKFTSFGYVMALRSSGCADEAQFREDLGKLCKALKDSMKGRTTESLIDFYALVKGSGLPEAFVKNALDADLIGEMLCRVGAQWEGDTIIKVPPNFGLTPL
jgi:hypothetical protein